MKHGARNDVVGTVTELVVDGGVMAQVKVEVSGTYTFSSVMTQESLDALKLSKGDKVRVIVKAVNVLLLKD